MFFKKDIEAKFEYSDAQPGSGVQKTEYLCLKLGEDKREFEDESAAIKAQGWVDIPTDKSFKLSGENLGKFVIYAKITDNAGHITCVNSNGVVIYKDSTPLNPEENIELNFTRTSDGNLTANVALNGNTIDKIINSTVNVSEPLTINEDYSIKDSTITFNNSYLKKLSAGIYNLSVHFNPAGVEFNPEEIGSDEPGTVPIKLTVQRGTQTTPLKIEGINSDNSYTYGDNPFQISTTGGDGDGAISYKVNTIGNDGEILEDSDENRVATISNDVTGTFLTLLRAGKFRITATRASNEIYDDKSTSQDIVVKPHDVTITGLTADDKYYNGTNEAEISGTPQLSWIHDNDKSDKTKVDITKG